MPKSKKIAIPDSHEAQAEIVSRANKGDAEAISALPELLDRVPEMRKSIGRALQKTTVGLTIDSACGQKIPALREALIRNMADLRKELEGPSPSPIERLLVDRAVACWLQTQAADYRAAASTSCSLAQANLHSKRQDRAHRRFLTAMKTLATIRKLALPALQINVGENQVNVANAGVDM